MTAQQLNQTKYSSLEEFLSIPETKPASEYIEGEISQKIMPQGEHSIIQVTLCEYINRVARQQKIALTLPELRCTFNNRSIVPDIAVFAWANIPRKDNGRIENRFLIPPDWIIEILSSWSVGEATSAVASPEQSPNRTIDKITFCLSRGTKLGWFIDTDNRSVMVLENDKLPVILRDDRSIPVLDVLGDWQISLIDIFNWLQI
jgi:Uma2 family endonuclease